MKTIVRVVFEVEVDDEVVEPTTAGQVLDALVVSDMGYFDKAKGMTVLVAGWAPAAAFEGAEKELSDVK